MDQDAFRQLLSKSKANRSATTSRGTFLPPKASAVQQKAAQAPKSDFKPRQLKKTGDAAYRDRAAERRHGGPGDFAEVEAVLKTFEEQHANDENATQVEEHRRYLGGDAEHTVLVKGLDFALLEQQKAKAAADLGGQDDDALEAAFLGVDPPEPQPATSSTEPRKRTREEIVKELKSKRSKTDNTNSAGADPQAADVSLDSGKFKPLGFKHIGSSSKDGKGMKKKKKKVKDEAKAAQPEETKEGPMLGTSESGPSAPSLKAKPQQEPEIESVGDDLDIFAGVEEYEGMDFDAEDDVRGSGRAEPGDDTTGDATLKDRPWKKWFEDDPDLEPKEPEVSVLSHSETMVKAQADTSESQTEHAHAANGEDDDGEPAMRIAPLTSSTVPSIRDILAADTALEDEERRKARKDKRKGIKSEGGEKKKASAETKLNRDYQKLQSYQAKKGDS